MSPLQIEPSKRDQYNGKRTYTATYEITSHVSINYEANSLEEALLLEEKISLSDELKEEPIDIEEALLISIWTDPLDEEGEMELEVWQI
tara:strand:- start:155 stop:421 length:267 start_codon:yes stop_codon:yes gene_type:complete